MFGTIYDRIVYFDGLLFVSNFYIIWYHFASFIYHLYHLYAITAPEVCRVLQHKIEKYIVIFNESKQTYEGLDPRRRYTLAQANPLQILDPDGDLVDIVGPA